MLGRVSVTSNLNGAKVYLDGVEKGTTSMTLFNVPDGIHTLTVMKDGYQIHSTMIRAQAGKQVRVYSNMTPMM